MPAINQLTRAQSISAGDLVPTWIQSNGAGEAASWTVVLAWIQDNIVLPGAFETQYAAPNATGFSVTIAPTEDGGSVYLNLTPLAGYAAGTIVLPALADCLDGQEVLVSCTQAVTTLTVSGNGSTVNGAPTTLAANAYFKLRFDQILSTWQRVG